MIDKSIIHLERALIKVTGKDAKKFLQGLITKDINKISSNHLSYCAMLNHQGRFLYDFMIFEDDGEIYLDCFKMRVDEVIKKLNFYKLKSEVTISKVEDIIVAQNINPINQSWFTFPDPRSTKIGYRSYIKNSKSNEFQHQNQTLYHKIRIQNKIAESEYDLTYEKSLILEFGFNDFAAIDYDKGCYIGQELTARTHHLGQLRKKIFLVKFKDNHNIKASVSYQESANLNLELKNTSITHQENKVGKILSVIKLDNINYGLALLKIDQDIGSKELYLLNHRITIIS